MEKIKLKEALNVYKQKVSVLKKGAEQEKYRIEQISKSFLGDIYTNEITSIEIASYRDQRLTTCNVKTKRLVSPATVRLELSLLSNFFDIARIEWGYCDGNPVKNVRKPKSPPGRDRRLTNREERQILRYAHAHSNHQLYSIVVLALETAMRQGEILNLTWENINLKSRVAHLPETKNGSKRDVPLSLKARDALIHLGVQSKGKIFTYTNSGIKSTWRLMMQNLCIDNLHFHDLRHEAVSRLFELGSLDMMEIAAISGHKSLSMLKRYTHLKAHKLVSKLEGNKSKGKSTVLGTLIPYPGELREQNGVFRIRMLDFDNLIAKAETLEEVKSKARDLLMRKILQSMRADEAIPSPDQYLDSVEECRLVMIDPLENVEKEHN